MVGISEHAHVKAMDDVMNQPHSSSPLHEDTVSLSYSELIDMTSPAPTRPEDPTSAFPRLELTGKPPHSPSIYLRGFLGSKFWSSNTASALIIKSFSPALNRYFSVVAV